MNILILDDEEIVHETLGDYFNDLGHNVYKFFDGYEALNFMQNHEIEIAFVDIRMPHIDGLEFMKQAQLISDETSLVVITGYASMQVAIKSLKIGALDFLIKPIKLEELDAILERTKLFRKLVQEKNHLRTTIRGIQHPSNPEIEMGWQFIGNSSAAHKIRQYVSEVVCSGCDTVLVTGETGVGKEVVAKEIHLGSRGKSSPFIAVNCPSLPDSLAESELFGHTKGSFTNATESRAGSFELADQGTLFLDEVGDLSLSTQASILRVIETRSVKRIGSAKEIPVSIQIISATNKDFQQNMRQNTFRKDLFYRLNRYHIHIPPLRDRQEDILVLAESFRAMNARAWNCKCKGITKGAQFFLQNYDFPGNVRELRNMIEKACIRCRSKECNVGIIKESLQDMMFTNYPNEPGECMQAVQNEKSQLIEALEKCRWNRRQAAQNLGIPYSTFRYKMVKYSIN